MIAAFRAVSRSAVAALQAQPALRTATPFGASATPGLAPLGGRTYLARGVLKLRCTSCRYAVRKWHVPILTVECSANPRHKQALTNPPHRSRAFPEHLLPYLVGKQYPRHPRWKMDHIFMAYSNRRDMILR